MKILKGVFIYTLVIIGIVLAIATITFGVMYFNPGTQIFGWSVINSSNVVLPSISTSGMSGSGQLYDINIDAGIHNVNIIHNYNDAKEVFVTKTDNMIGIVQNYKYIPEADVTFDSASKSVDIQLQDLPSTVLANGSKLDVFLPNMYNYNLTIKTTTGNIEVNGESTQGHLLNVKALNISTTSGNFTMDGLNTTLIGYDIHDEQDAATAPAISHTYNPYGQEFIGYGFKTDWTDFLKDRVYYAYLPLTEFVAVTESGDLDFDFATEKTKNTTIMSNFSSGSIDVVDFLTDVTTHTTIENAIKNKEVNNFYVDVKGKGNVYFDKVLTASFIIEGENILIKAGSILTYDDFKFNAPDGHLDIDILGGVHAEDAKLSINTENIDVALDQVNGQLYIATTYGNIDIGRIDQEAILNSDTGNITVKQANAAVIASSQNGNITIGKYRDALNLTNVHGKITASFDIDWYNENSTNGNLFNDSSNAKYYKTAIVKSSNGPVTLNNVVFQVSVTTTENTILNVSFAKMHIVGAGKQALEHKFNLNNGSANIKSVIAEEFMFKGNGKISGKISSAEFAANEDYELKFSTEHAQDQLSKLTITNNTQTPASVVFAPLTA